MRQGAWTVYGLCSALQGVGFIGRSHRLRVRGEPATGRGVGIPMHRPLAEVSSLLLFLKSPSSGLWRGWATSRAVEARTTHEEPKPHPWPHSLRVGGRTDVYSASGTDLREQGPGTGSSRSVGCRPKAAALWPPLDIPRRRVYWTVTQPPCARRAGDWEQANA